MNKEWRPKGWTALWTEKEIKSYPGSIRLQQQLCYELGAERMLEALFKLAEESPTKTFTIDSRAVVINDTAEREGE